MQCGVKLTIILRKLFGSVLLEKPYMASLYRSGGVCSWRKYSA
jgi:hypothetical protein